MIHRSEHDVRFIGGIGKIVTRVALLESAKTHRQSVAVETTTGATRGRGRGRGDCTEVRSVLSLKRTVATRAFKSMACGQTRISALLPSIIIAATYGGRCDRRWSSTHTSMIMLLS